jgi:hypothetical protein
MNARNVTSQWPGAIPVVGANGGVVGASAVDAIVHVEAKPGSERAATVIFLDGQPGVEFVSWEPVEDVLRRIKAARSRLIAAGLHDDQTVAYSD